jgi:cation diffusion facilitator family transporter
MSDCCCECKDAADKLERRTLWTLLVINGVMFIAEATAGWWGESTGLIADSLDMLADASVYGIALYAVGRSRRLQASAATASGVLQIALGLCAFFEVVRRFLYGSEPVSVLMIVVGALALIANVICLMLISKHRDGGIHMRASWIFSANDVIANLGVIISGILVMVLGSRLPDLIIGAVISAVVLRGGIQILREAKAAQAEETDP